MTEATAIKPEAKKPGRPKSKPALKGKRAIIWLPEKDYRQNGPSLKGYENVRRYTYVFRDEVKCEKAKQTARQTFLAGSLINVENVDAIPYTPIFQHLDLMPGLNWVDAQLWDNSLKEADRRIDEAQEGDDTTYVEELTRLLNDRAIIALEPKSEVTRLVGSVNDYPSGEIRRLVIHMDDEKELEKLQRDTDDRDVHIAISERLDQLNKGNF